jgi:hypothetical protein
VAKAWRAADGSAGRSWAQALGQAADISDETIYERRRRWLRQYGIDISIPYQFYVDLLSLRSLSATVWARRAAIIAAASSDDAKGLLALLKEALDDFDEQRRDIVGRTVDPKTGSWRSDWCGCSGV